jgi:hypothetical protein
MILKRMYVGWLMVLVSYQFLIVGAFGEGGGGGG